MVPAPFSTKQFSRLVAHLNAFDRGQRRVMERLYDAPASDAEELADYWLRNPEVVLEVVRREISSSLGWRAVEEVTLEHDLGVSLDWVPLRQRRLMTRLGLVRTRVDEAGQERAVMPGALAAIFAGHIEGERGSLPILLGREKEERVRGVCEAWGLSSKGSKVEQIARLSDYFAREEMVEELLDALPDPDWIGDAMMVLELGGLCYWQQIYGYDLETTLGRGDNVVPLMRRAEREYQQDVAQTLMNRGVLFRLEAPRGGGYPMVAVPEELWPGLWELGQRWLMDWTAQAVFIVGEDARSRPALTREPALQAALKWLVVEAQNGRLKADEAGITASSRAALQEVIDPADGASWEEWWSLGSELRIIGRGKGQQVEVGGEAKTLLNLSRLGFQREVLLEWCLGYSAAAADEPLSQAMGIDEAWRERAVKLLKRQAELVPHWMEGPGVDSALTGGGWLRETGLGPDEVVRFEVGLTLVFVVLTKMSWLDVMSLLEAERFYRVDALAELLQCIAGLAMFQQLKRVLQEQPAAIYLPFQRASFLMDHLHRPLFYEWVEAIFDRLLIPLGVAGRSEDGERVWVDGQALRVESPPGWPEGQRRGFIEELFGNEMSFDLPDRREGDLRALAPVSDQDRELICIEKDVDELLAAAKNRQVLSFDGWSMELEPER